MQTYPCGHKVVCRRCFVKTIQIALTQRSLPLRCVICRAKILRLKHTHSCKLPSIPPFQYRSSFRRSSKRSPDLVTSNCSLEANSWSTVTKHSRSLPGINRSSLKYKSSADRSHSGTSDQKIILHLNMPGGCFDGRLYMGGYSSISLTLLEGRILNFLRVFFFYFSDVYVYLIECFKNDFTGISLEQCTFIVKWYDKTHSLKPVRNDFI